LKNKRVIVTGGTGFLGRHLTPRLNEEGYNVSLFSEDIRKFSMYKEKSDIVVHLAGINRQNSQQSLYDLFDVNIAGTLEVIQYCKRMGARCIIASSSAVYRPTREPVRLSETSKFGPVTDYGISKILAEKLCKMYSELSKITITSCRIFNMYGIGQKGDYIISYLIKKKKDSETPVLKSPHSYRDYIHINDVAHAFIELCEYQHDGYLAFNIGTGNEASPYHLARMIDNSFAIDENQLINKERDFVIADINRITNLTDWIPKIPLEQGIAELLQ